MKNISKYILIGIPTILLVAALVFFLLKLPTQEKQRKYGDLIVTGNTQLEEKEFAKALTTFNDAALIINTKYEAYEGIAKILVLKNQLGQLNDLITKSTTLLSADSLSKLYSYLGEGYLKVGNYDSAVDNYQKAVNANGSNELAKLGLAQSYLSVANYEKAQQNVDISKDSVNYEKSYVLKLMAQSKFADIKTVVAENYVAKDEANKKIIADFTTLSKVDATEELYIAALLGRIYVNNGYSKLAIALLEPMREKLLEYADGVYVLASAYYNIGDNAKVITLLKDYSNPNADPDVYMLLARANSEIGEVTDTTKNYDSAVTASGDKSEAIYVEYVKYLLDQAQYVKAKETLDKASKKYSKENWLDTYYLRMYSEQKNNAKAQFYLDKLAKATNMTDVEKKEYLFWAISQYIEAQKTNDAIILLAKLKDIDKFNAQYYYLAGKLHLQTANTTEAKSELEQAIDYDLTGEVTENAKKLLSRVN